MAIEFIFYRWTLPCKSTLHNLFGDRFDTFFSEHGIFKLGQIQ
jgi:hypothetical protein